MSLGSYRRRKAFARKKEMQEAKNDPVAIKHLTIARPMQKISRQKDWKRNNVHQNSFVAKSTGLSLKEMKDSGLF